MLPSQYGKKQYALEVAAVLAVAGVLASWGMVTVGGSERSSLWMFLGYLLGMVSMGVIAGWYACSRTHEEHIVNRRTERR